MIAEHEERKNSTFIDNNSPDYDECDLSGLCDNIPTYKTDSLSAVLDADISAVGRKVVIPVGTDLNDLTEWKEPIPIQTDLLPVQTLTKDMIPEPLRDWLTDIADRMKCPIDFVAATVIVMVSSLIGTRLTIKPKSRDSWTIVPNLWGAVIGEPSIMKTPSTGEVFKPLDRLVAEERERYEEDLLQYEAAKATYDAQKAAYAAQEKKKVLGKANSENEASSIAYPRPPKKPTERRYKTNDATIEKLAELLNENPTGLLQFRDELIGLLAGWDKQGHEEDRSFYLEAWNGNGSKTVDRIGRGTTHVKNVCVSLFGGIQPSKLLGYLQAATSYENDGFVQRLQVAVYPDKPAWGYEDRYPDKRAKDRAFDLIRKIVDADYSSISYDADEYDRFSYTRFDGEAQEIFKEWLTDLETRILPNESGLLMEHFTKYRSLMPSLALVFHVITYVDNPNTNLSDKQLVTADAARMATKWCEYLMSHARRIYGLLDTQQTSAARVLLDRIKKGKLSDGFKARDIVQRGWTSLDKTHLVESALAELVSCNWLKEVEPQSPANGRPESSHYLIHPSM